MENHVFRKIQNFKICCLPRGPSGAALGGPGEAFGRLRAPQPRVRSHQGGSEVLIWTTLPHAFVVFKNALFGAKAPSRRPLVPPWGVPGGRLGDHAASSGPWGGAMRGQKGPKGKCAENVVCTIGTVA